MLRRFANWLLTWGPQEGGLAEPISSSEPASSTGLSQEEKMQNQINLFDAVKAAQTADTEQEYIQKLQEAQNILCSLPQECLGACNMISKVIKMVEEKSRDFSAIRTMMNDCLQAQHNTSGFWTKLAWAIGHARKFMSSQSA